MAPRRPTAFDVSFPEEEPLVNQPPSAPTSGPKKRKIFDAGRSEHSVKQRQQPPVAYYTPEQGALPESAELVIPGEELEELEDEERPIRVLTDFVIFDPMHRNEMVSLAAIEEVDVVDRHFEGAGFVSPYFLDEDEGQEDEDEDEENRESKMYVRLGAILRYSVDYTKENEEFYIETEYAWYILRKPSQSYEDFYRMFYTPRRVAQLLVSAARRNPYYTYDMFLQRYRRMVDIFGRTCQEDDLWHAAEEVKIVLEETAGLSSLRSVPLVKHVLKMAPSTPRPRKRRAVTRQLPLINARLRKRSDLEILKTEHQTNTHVTPFIAQLIESYVMEDICVVGARPPLPDKGRVEEQERQAYQRLRQLVRTVGHKRDIDWQKEDRFVPGSDYVRSVTIDGERYDVGDYVVTPIADANKPAKYPFPDEDCLPENAKIPDFFWFARIVYFVPSPPERGAEPRAHIQWLEHGSQIFFEEMAHPQELFLNDLCGNIPIRSIIGKVVVREKPGSLSSYRNEYFYKFKHEKESGTLLSIDFQRLQVAANATAPENCPVCLISEEHEHDIQPRELRKGSTMTGFAFNGHKFHQHDFVLFKAIQGPAHIGHIRKIGTDSVVVKQVGRISSLGAILPDNFCKDERHTYLTDDEETVPAIDLIQTIHVLHVGGPRDGNIDLEDWLAESPSNFYMKYAFPSIAVQSWHDRKRIEHGKLKTCSACRTERLEEQRLLQKFISVKRRQPMAVLDLFGGVGAFSLGMKESFPGLNIAHCIEISPSAAETFSRNSPGTIVHNQCANTILRYAIKKQEGHHIEPPMQLGDGKTPVPDPPKKGEIQLITAGFPCQTHSALNMFKLANDIKSNLIFNTLSYMDVYRPAFGYFENVPGFLSYALNATQVSKHRLEGGIKMGGLKLLARALVDLGYQIRFCLLQAGNYGIPQGRIRFFLIAAKDGNVLPKFPQPTHDFPQNRSLRINFPNGDSIYPIKADSGTGLHSFVTIDDAIGDLPQFDWKHPRPQSLSAEERREMQTREQMIPALHCRPSQEAQTTFCGYRGKNVVYHHRNPQTRYQLMARRRETMDLQHYTKRLIEKKVERVVSIPLEPRADYRSLAPHLAEWQLFNPISHVARTNYRAGPYGRLDGKSYFPTTVTNVDPTAKQSKVLHPHCRRMVTVRELARSQGFPDHFVFKANENKVTMMHRQIGNAVPLPVAAALGRELRDALFKQWLDSPERRQDNETAN